MFKSYFIPVCILLGICIAMPHNMEKKFIDLFDPHDIITKIFLRGCGMKIDNKMIAFLSINDTNYVSKPVHMSTLFSPLSIGNPSSVFVNPYYNAPVRITNDLYEIIFLPRINGIYYGYNTEAIIDAWNIKGRVCSNSTDTIMKICGGYDCLYNRFTEIKLTNGCTFININGTLNIGNYISFNRALRSMSIKGSINSSSNVIFYVHDWSMAFYISVR